MDISAWLPRAIHVMRDISRWPGASGFQDTQNILLQLYQSKVSLFFLQLKWLSNLILLMHLLFLFAMSIYNKTTSISTTPLQIANQSWMGGSRQKLQEQPPIGAETFRTDLQLLRAGTKKNHFPSRDQVKQQKSSSRSWGSWRRV